MNGCWTTMAVGVCLSVLAGCGSQQASLLGPDLEELAKTSDTGGSTEDSGGAGEAGESGGGADGDVGGAVGDPDAGPAPGTGGGLFGDLAGGGQGSGADPRDEAAGSTPDPMASGGAPAPEGAAGGDSASGDSAAIEEAGADGQTQSAVAYDSPVKIYARMGRMGPEWNYSEEDLQIMSDKFEAIIGLDGHGYNFPGAIEAFRAINEETPVLTMWNTMSTQLVGEPFERLDVVEGVFIHSADPASLRVVTLNNRAVGFFRRDARNEQMAPYYQPAGVTEYIVERSAGPGGPFTVLGAPIPENGSDFYVFADLITPGRHYRVRSRLANGNLVDYSWPTPVAPPASAAIVGVQLEPDGAMAALCYGSGCPGQPQNLVLERDLDYDLVLGENSCGSSGCERQAFSAVQARPDGGRLYTGTLPLPAPWPFSYRVAMAGSPSVRCPAQGAYQRRGYNNRIEMQQHGALLVWPDHPLWREMVTDRLVSAMNFGYDGMRLDFTFDNIDWFWIASGVPPDWPGPQDTRVADGVAGLFQELRAAAPRAIILFNGYFLPRERENYFDFLDIASGAEFEFFAYGLHEWATTYDDRTHDAMGGVFVTQELDRWAVAVAGRHAEDIKARMESLTMYLLLVDDNVFFSYETCCASQDLAYFPEWDVPLGDPMAALEDPQTLIDPRGDLLLTRRFDNGEVFFNYDDEPVSLSLPGLRYQLSVTGGKSPFLGGDGEAHYTPVQSLTLNGRSGAIVVRVPPAE